MAEFLKDYHLYADMTRLNNQTYFAAQFDVPEINQFLLSIRTRQDLYFHKKMAKIYYTNLRSGGEKSAYVVLKWLICLHRQIHNIQNAELLEDLSEHISKIQKPKFEEKVEKFIHEDINLPYIHFLAKLCLIKSQELASRPYLPSPDNKQNHLPNNVSNNLSYLKFNLLSKCTDALIPTMIDLHSYFSAYYPLLATLPSLIYGAMSRLLKEVRMEVKVQPYRMIRQEQLLQIQRQMDKINEIMNDDKSFEGETIEIGEKLTFLMDSEKRYEDSAYPIKLADHDCTSFQ